MTWALVAGAAIFIAVCWLFYGAGKKSQQNSELKRTNREKDALLDAQVEAAHRQEKREADHEARVAEIIRGHGLDIGRINRLLNDYPPPGEAAGAVRQKSVSP